jgi:hypothetical protein
MLEAMEEITFQVQRDEQSGLLTAWWDDSSGSGGITTQLQDLRDLQQHITEAWAFTLTREPLRTGSASTSSAILSWFRRETAPGYLGTDAILVVGTLQSILRQAGVSLDDFRNFVGSSEAVYE